MGRVGCGGLETENGQDPSNDCKRVSLVDSVVLEKRGKEFYVSLFCGFYYRGRLLSLTVNKSVGQVSQCMYAE